MLSVIMKRIVESYWFIPSITVAVCMASFASVFLRLFPLPYYLFKALEVMLLLCAGLIIWSLVQRRYLVALKAGFISLVGLGGWYLYGIQ